MLDDNFVKIIEIEGRPVALFRSKDMELLTGSSEHLRSRESLVEVIENLKCQGHPTSMYEHALQVLDAAIQEWAKTQWSGHTSREIEETPLMPTPAREAESRGRREPMPHAGGGQTPEGRAAVLIGRINETTDTASLERMIADEIRAAVEEAGESEGRHGAFRLVKHPAFNFIREDSPFVRSLEVGCYRCGVDTPEPGKTTLYFTDDGYHCESCMYDEYVNLRTRHLSLFPVQFLTVNELKDALYEELADGGAEPDDGLLSRLTAEIADGIKNNQYLKAFPELVSMLMRGIYYRTLRRHKEELPPGVELPPADLDL